MSLEWWVFVCVCFCPRTSARAAVSVCSAGGGRLRAPSHVTRHHSGPALAAARSQQPAWQAWPTRQAGRRSALSARMPHQRRLHPASAEARSAGGARWAQSRANRLTSSAASQPHRPPTSHGNTTRRCGPAACSSG